MFENVVVDHLGDESIPRTPARGGLLKNVDTACILLNPAFDRVQLAIAAICTPTAWKP